METLIQRFEKLEHLPSHPGVLAELCLALADPDTSSDELERIVSRDQALAAAVLQRSNAVCSGVATEITSVRDAVIRLGKMDLLRIAAMHDTIGPLVEAGEGYGLERGVVWHAARAGAIAAGAIAERTKLVEPAVAFTAALLRDCGKLAMDHLLDPSDLATVLRERPPHVSSIELERATFGFDHAEAGAELAMRWNLPVKLVRAIRHHHDPHTAGDDPLVDVVHCADALCSMLGLGVGLDGLAYPLETNAREHVGLSLNEMQGYLGLLAEYLREVSETTRGQGPES